MDRRDQEQEGMVGEGRKGGGELVRDCEREERARVDRERQTG